VGRKTLYYKPSNYLKKGDSSFRKKQYWDALNYYSLALRDDSFNIVPQIKCAHAEQQLGYDSLAIERLNRAFHQVGAHQFLQDYVIKNYKNIGKNIGSLQRQLNSRYNLPIPQKLLRMSLQAIKNERKESIKRQEFEQFTRKLPWREFIILAHFIEPFLKHYGKDYKKYIPQFHQYLLGRGYTISRYELEEHIKKQKREMDRPTWRYKLSIDVMTGTEFEQFLANAFKLKGYKVTVTKPSHEGGCDLLLEGFERLIVVQAKRRKKKVGTSAIQEAYTAKRLYRAQEALVITNSYFTTPAKKMAKKVGVELWDRKILLKELSLI